MVIFISMNSSITIPSWLTKLIRKKLKVVRPGYNLLLDPI